MVEAVVINTHIDSCGERGKMMAEGIRCLVTERWRNFSKLSPQTDQLKQWTIVVSTQKAINGYEPEKKVEMVNPKETNRMWYSRPTAGSGSWCVKNSTSLANKSARACSHLTFYFSVQTFWLKLFIQNTCSLSHCWAQTCQVKNWSEMLKGGGVCVWE